MSIKRGIVIDITNSDPPSPDHFVKRAKKGKGKADEFELSALATSSSAIPPAATTLLCSSATTAALKSFYETHVEGKKPVKASSNQNLIPIIKPLSDNALLFAQDDIIGAHGHCWALWTRKKSGGIVTEALKLTEGGSNNDSPRTNLIAGINDKVYIYHALAYHKANTSPSTHLTLPLLNTLTRDKKEVSPNSMLHLCGHKWCMNANHYAVGSKKLNEEQTSCHKGLQSAKTAEAIDSVSQHYCHHNPKCWTVVYKGEFADCHSWTVL